MERKRGQLPSLHVVSPNRQGERKYAFEVGLHLPSFKEGPEEGKAGMGTPGRCIYADQLRERREEAEGGMGTDGCLPFFRRQKNAKKKGPRDCDGLLTLALLLKK